MQLRTLNIFLNNICLLPVLFLLPFLTTGQDTTHKKWEFKKQVAYWSSWEFNSLDALVSAPQAIKQLRRNATQLPINFDTLTDNPLRHGATYLTLKTQSTLLSKITLFADLYAEHRGVSYGIFDNRNTIVYPVMRLEANDTIDLLSRKIILKGKAGHFLDERLDEGLIVYNIDLQGIQVQSTFNKWTLGYTIYGDLYGGIGLNIDDLTSYSIRRDFANSKSYFGLSLVTAKPPFSTPHNNRIINFFGRKTFNSSALYAQLGIRVIDRENPAFNKNLLKQAGIVVGYSIKKYHKKFEFITEAQIRYYGYVFNLSHADLELRYRDPANNYYEMYANTVGKYLYPLRKFETPFSQWAVFTEYQGYTLNGINLLGSSVYKHSPKINLSVEYDINYITAKLDNIFYSGIYGKINYLYPFFSLNVIYKPVFNTNITLFITNKAMNLDLHYPTHYLLYKPCVGFKLIALFE